VIKKDFPKIHYYDQDFVDIYNRSWAWIQDYWFKGDPELNIKNSFFNYKEYETINLFESAVSTFFLVYYNNKYAVAPMLDNFYALQEENGAIRLNYDLKEGKPVFTENNPEGVSPPLLAWVEYNLYHKVGQKRRIKEVMPYLELYYSWLDETFKNPETGLYHVPLEATMMDNAPREEMYYPVDFNSQQALNCLYMSALGDILNDKELSFKYKKQYFSLKTRINSLMWNQDDSIYYDLDKEQNQIKVKTAAAFWPLLAEIPNEARAEDLIELLKDPDHFGTDNPFPSLAANEPAFNKKGDGFNGSVYPFLTFMIIKGLEKYARYDFARECAIRHLYYVLDTFHPDGNKKGTLWEAYAPLNEGPAVWEDESRENRQLYLSYTALSTITLMIENVVGLYISLPRKTVDWIVPTLELMGIEDLSLKRNMITILSNKSGRGWEIRLESEKLYYFTIDILGKKKKTLPIPSGKCSMLIDKL